MITSEEEKNFGNDLKNKVKVGKEIQKRKREVKDLFNQRLMNTEILLEIVEKFGETTSRLG